MVSEFVTQTDEKVIQGFESYMEDHLVCIPAKNIIKQDRDKPPHTRRYLTHVLPATSSKLGVDLRPTVESIQVDFQQFLESKRLQFFILLSREIVYSGDKAEAHKLAYGLNVAVALANNLAQTHCSYQELLRALEHKLEEVLAFDSDNHFDPFESTKDVSRFVVDSPSKPSFKRGDLFSSYMGHHYTRRDRKTWQKPHAREAPFNGCAVVKKQSFANMSDDLRSEIREATESRNKNGLSAVYFQ